LIDLNIWQRAASTRGPNQGDNNVRWSIERINEHTVALAQASGMPGQNLSQLNKSRIHRNKRVVDFTALKINEQPASR
jgi:hypothetical protein